MSVEQGQKVMGLQQHVAELGVGDAICDSALDGLFGEHVVDREVFADISHEVDRVDLFEPVGILYEKRGIVRSIEIEKTRELGPDALEVVLKRVPCKQRTLLGLPARIAD